MHNIHVDFTTSCTGTRQICCRRRRHASGSYQCTPGKVQESYHPFQDNAHQIGTRESNPKLTLCHNFLTNLEDLSTTLVIIYQQSMKFNHTKQGNIIIRQRIFNLKNASHCTFMAKCSSYSHEYSYCRNATTEGLGLLLLLSETVHECC